MAVCNDFIHCECASIVEEMEWEQGELMKARDELLEALEKMVGLFEPGRVYDFREVSALSSEALHIAMAALAKATGVLAEGDSEVSQSCP